MMGVKITQKQFKAFLDGDEQVLRWLIATESPKLFGYIRRYVKSKMDTEEIAQDVFLELWRERHKIPSADKIFGYIYSSAKFKALHHLRSAVTNEIELNECLIRIDESIPDAESYYKAAELSLTISRAIEKMPEQRRKVFKMSRIDGLKRGEIAQKMNLSPQTVSNYMNEAIEQLKKIITILFFFTGLNR